MILKADNTAWDCELEVFVPTCDPNRQENSVFVRDVDPFIQKCISFLYAVTKGSPYQVSENYLDEESAVDVYKDLDGDYNRERRGQLFKKTRSESILGYCLLHNKEISTYILVFKSKHSTIKYTITKTSDITDFEESLYEIALSIKDRRGPVCTLRMYWDLCELAELISDHNQSKLDNLFERWVTLMKCIDRNGVVIRVFTNIDAEEFLSALVLEYAYTDKPLTEPVITAIESSILERIKRDSDFTLTVPKIMEYIKEAL